MCDNNVVYTCMLQYFVGGMLHVRYIIFIYIYLATLVIAFACMQRMSLAAARNVGL